MPFWKNKAKPPLRHPKNDIADQGVVFRRSRTLTGATSSEVSSATESRSQLKSPRLKEHELKKHRRLLVMAIVGLIGLSSLCVWLLEQYIVRVDHMSSLRTVVTPIAENEYQDVISEYLNGRPLERFRFMLNEERLNEYLRESKKEVQSIEITGGEGLAVTNGIIQLRTPVASWQVGTVKYYVDAEGETYLKNYYAEPVVSVKDESGITPETTELVASSRLLRFLGKTVSGLNASGLGTVTSVTIPGGTLRQLDFMLDTKPYRIKTHMDREAVGQVADVVSAIKFLDSKAITPEYIDVRVEGKAFYR